MNVNKRQVSPRHVTRLRRYVCSTNQYKATVILRTSYDTLQEVMSGGFVRNHVATKIETMIDKVMHE
jgi:hypothetical protein